MPIPTPLSIRLIRARARLDAEEADLAREALTAAGWRLVPAATLLGLSGGSMHRLIHRRESPEMADILAEYQAKQEGRKQATDGNPKPRAKIRTAKTVSHRETRAAQGK